jgi:hypothetical protein
MNPMRRASMALLVVAAATLQAGEPRAALARGVEFVPLGVDTPLVAAPRAERYVAWARALAPLDVAYPNTGATARLRLYGGDGEVDDAARATLERVVSNDGDRHDLAPRLEQLVAKAAYHFGGAPVVVVSAWRPNAGRHTTGEGLDFKLDGVKAAALAAWLRGLPRVGVGIYVHPRTQYVHLDIRDESYHWIDASPPGITWREKQLADPSHVTRDASWTPDADLP